VNDLIAFLRAQLDEDERAARDAGGRNWGREAYGCVVDAADNGLIVYGEGTPSREQADHIARHDPVRVLADVSAKRQILNEHRVIDGRCHVCTAIHDGHARRFRAPCPTLRLLALPYADHPDYREEWRP
jgi:hypothetical protein